MSGSCAGTQPERPADRPALIERGHGQTRDIGGTGTQGRAALHEGHRLGGPAVVAQRCQLGGKRVEGGAGEVGADPAGVAAVAADQVATEAADRAVHVGAGAARSGQHVAGYNRAGEEHPAAGAVGGVVESAAILGRVVRHRAVGERQAAS